MYANRLNTDFGKRQLLSLIVEHYTQDESTDRNLKKKSDLFRKNIINQLASSSSLNKKSDEFTNKYGNLMMRLDDVPSFGRKMFDGYLDNVHMNNVILTEKYAKVEYYTRNVRIDSSGFMSEKLITELKKYVPEKIIDMLDDNIFIAGGLISRLLCNEKILEDTDIDIFIVYKSYYYKKFRDTKKNIRNKCASKLNRDENEDKTIDDRILTLINYIISIGYTFITTSNQAMTFRYNNCSDNTCTSTAISKLPIQLIFRSNESSLSRIIGEFDLPPASIAYTGKDILLTKLSAFSYLTMSIPFIPRVYSHTFCERIDKYLSRGFILINVDPEKIYHKFDTDTMITSTMCQDSSNNIYRNIHKLKSKSFFDLECYITLMRNGKIYERDEYHNPGEVNMRNKIIVVQELINNTLNNYRKSGDCEDTEGHCQECDLINAANIIHTAEYKLCSKCECLINDNPGNTTQGISTTQGIFDRDIHRVTIDGKTYKVFKFTEIERYIRIVKYLSILPKFLSDNYISIFEQLTDDCIDIADIIIYNNFKQTGILYNHESNVDISGDHNVFQSDDRNRYHIVNNHGIYRFQKILQSIPQFCIHATTGTVMLEGIQDKYNLGWKCIRELYVEPTDNIQCFNKCGIAMFKDEKIILDNPQLVEIAKMYVLQIINKSNVNSCDDIPDYFKKIYQKISAPNIFEGYWTEYTIREALANKLVYTSIILSESYDKNGCKILDMCSDPSMLYGFKKYITIYEKKFSKRITLQAAIAKIFDIKPNDSMYDSRIINIFPIFHKFTMKQDVYSTLDTNKFLSNLSKIELIDKTLCVLVEKNCRNVSLDLSSLSLPGNNDYNNTDYNNTDNNADYNNANYNNCTICGIDNHCAGCGQCIPCCVARKYENYCIECNNVSGTKTIDTKTINTKTIDTKTIDIFARRDRIRLVDFIDFPDKEYIRGKIGYINLTNTANRGDYNSIYSKFTIDATNYSGNNGEFNGIKNHGDMDEIIDNNWFVKDNGKYVDIGKKSLPLIHIHIDSASFQFSSIATMKKGLSADKLNN